ncbi:hypothetical protein APHNP_0418 [Anaplasma phagocytophilum str. ApNP]|uniref:Uncharacterized protein n=1 Tax=Anaplasma phagocytophilum str. ApNP TaxID=1359153 RepID=A0A0F3NH08_ANAPH|nr:hypothetical protein APHNP_0418 [Anaplasma phagocytophilum str. ApNP]
MEIILCLEGVFSCWKKVASIYFYREGVVAIDNSVESYVCIIATYPF